MLPSCSRSPVAVVARHEVQQGMLTRGIIILGSCYGRGAVLAQVPYTWGICRGTKDYRY